MIIARGQYKPISRAFGNVSDGAALAPGCRRWTCGLVSETWGAARDPLCVRTVANERGNGSVPEPRSPVLFNLSSALPNTHLGKRLYHLDFLATVSRKTPATDPCTVHRTDVIMRLIGAWFCLYLATYSRAASGPRTSTCHSLTMVRRRAVVVAAVDHFLRVFFFLASDKIP